MPEPTPPSDDRDHALLLVHGGAHGDLVLAVTFAEAVRAALGCGSLQVLCRSRLACYLTQRGVVSGWKSIENPGFVHLFTEQPLARSAAAWLDQAVHTLSLLGDALRSDLATFHIDPRPRAAAGDQPILAQWAAQLAQQGGPALPPASSASARPWLQRSSSTGAGTGRSVIIHPGSGSPDKCWPLSCFAAVAAQLRQAGHGVRFMIGPAEQERWGADAVVELSAVAEVIVEPDICRAAEHIEKVQLYIGNDSGLTHLAARLGLCVVAVFTGTSPTVWGPIGPHVTVLQSPEVDAVLSAAQ